MTDRCKIRIPVGVLGFILGGLVVLPVSDAVRQASGAARPAELNSQLIPDFLKLPFNLYFSEVSGVALNSRHTFLYSSAERILWWSSMRRETSCAQRAWGCSPDRMDYESILRTIFGQLTMVLILC
jgi:hypothetical protein